MKKFVLSGIFGIVFLCTEFCRLIMFRSFATPSVNADSNNKALAI